MTWPPTVYCPQGWPILLSISEVPNPGQMGWIRKFYWHCLQLQMGDHISIMAMWDSLHFWKLQSERVSVGNGMSACWQSEVMFQKEWLSHVTWQQLVWLKIEIVRNAEALESVVGRSQTSNVAKDGLFRNVSPRGGCATTHLSVYYTHTIRDTQVDNAPNHMGHPMSAEILLYPLVMDRPRFCCIHW